MAQSVPYVFTPSNSLTEVVWASWQNVCWTAPRALIYEDVLILFPTFQASPVLPTLIWLVPFLSLKTHWRRHLEAIAVATKRFKKSGLGMQQGYRPVRTLMWLVGQEAATVGKPEKSASFLENDSLQSSSSWLILNPENLFLCDPALCLLCIDVMDGEHIVCNNNNLAYITADKAFPKTQWFILIRFE